MEGLEKVYREENKQTIEEFENTKNSIIYVSVLTGMMILILIILYLYGKYTSI